METAFSPEDLVVTGMGMVSCLGLDAVSSCAAARAGISRRSDDPEYQVYNRETAGMEPVAVHPVPVLSRGFTGFGRWLRLAEGALEDLLAGQRKKPEGAALILVLPGEYLAGRLDPDGGGVPAADPETYREFQERCRIDFARSLARDLGLVFHPRHCHLLFGDDPGFAEALDIGRRLLKSGEVRQCLVGGVDSFLEPECLGGLEGLGLIKTPERPHGLAPGEAAAFLLVEERDGSEAGKRRILAALGGWAGTREDAHRFSGKPNLGRALSDAIRAVGLRRPENGKNVGFLIGNLNGDPWRNAEWGMAQARLPRHLLGLEEWHPAEHFGEIGAAQGPVAVGMAIRGWERRYLAAAEVLIWLSGYAGAKCAIRVARGTAEV